MTRYPFSGVAGCRPLAVVLALAFGAPPVGGSAAPAARQAPNAARALAAPSGVAAPAVDTVVAFRLSDQFGRVHDATEYRGRTLLVVGAGRAGRAAGTAWVEALNRLQDDSTGAGAIPVVAVADLRGVPRLLRRVVRGRFPDDRRQAVLLDWDGALARRFGFEPERSTILVVAPSGRVHARTSSAAVDTVAARAVLREAAELELASGGRAGSTP